jgi:hypothetical protein
MKLLTHAADPPDDIRKTVALDPDVRPALDRMVANRQKTSKKHITKSLIVNELIRKSNCKNLEHYTISRKGSIRDRLTLCIDHDNFKKINDLTAKAIVEAANSDIKTPSPNFSRTLNNLLRKELGL